MTQTRMQAATQRVVQIMRRSRSGKITCTIMLLIAVLVVVIVVLLKK